MPEEIFPLDKMLPKNTVLSLFLERYNAAFNKKDLMRNSPETKRVREAYFGLFAGVALDILQGENHLMLLPRKPDNDVCFLWPNDLEAVRPKMNMLEFDVKEYEANSFGRGFNKFMEETVSKNRIIRGVIVGVHEDIGTLRPEDLFFDQRDRGVMIVAAESQSDENPMRAKIIYALKDSILFDDTVNLDDHLNAAAPHMVYDDIVRGL